MPFDAIYIPFGFEGLCPPGLGTSHYVEVSTALTELLPHLLPVNSIPRVIASVAAVTMESNSGYNLLFRIMVLSVLSVDPTLPLLAPLWTSSTKLFEFCRSRHFYFSLQEKKGIFYDDRTKSGIFLRAIGLSEYADVVTMLQSHINLFCGDFDDSLLPYHLCIDGLTEAINNHSIAHLGDVGFPWVHHTTVDDAQAIQGYSPLASCIDSVPCRDCPSLGHNVGGRDAARPVI